MADDKKPQWRVYNRKGILVEISPTFNTLREARRWTWRQFCGGGQLAQRFDGFFFKNERNGCTARVEETEDGKALRLEMPLKPRRPKKTLSTIARYEGEVSP